MQKPQVMRIKKTIVLAVEEDLSVDLTFHNISASILAKWAQKIVRSHYIGNLNAAIQNPSQKTIACSFLHKAYSNYVEA